MESRSEMENMRYPECRPDNKEDIHVCANRGDSFESTSATSAESLGMANASIETVPSHGDDAALAMGDEKKPGTQSSASAPEVQIIPRTRLIVFGAIFYILLLSYLVIVLFFPQSRIVRSSTIFETFWAQFIFLVLCLVGITLSLFGLFCFVCEEYLRSRWYQPKIGKLSVSEGFITREQLKQVLDEQEQRIGEVLRNSGRITQEQLEKAIAKQKGTSARLGEILKHMGYATEEDIYWALGKMQRKVGEILVDKGMLTKEDVDWLVGQQKSGPRRI
jgi:hypothetical protein